MTKRLIVFDLDGTLIDSAPDLHDALVATFDQLNRPAPDLQTTISFVGHGAGMLMRRALAATGGASKAEETAALKMFLAAYHSAGVSRTNLYSGVTDTLSELQDAGATLGVCTNKPQEPALEVCEALGLTASMAMILGARPEFPRKPDPAPLLHVVKALNAKPEDTVFVGDSVVDHQTAAAANIRFAFFTGGYINGEIGAPEPDLQFATWGRDLAQEIIKLIR